MKRTHLLYLLFLNSASVWSAAKAETFVFGEDWTNSTEWVTSGVKWSTKQKMNYFSKGGAYALSPEFSFAITSMVVTARNTNKTNPRTLCITPFSSGIELTDDAWSFTPAISDSDLTAYTNGWPRDLEIDSLRITVVDGAGNTYIETMELYGPAFIDPPESLTAPKPGATHTKLTWKNPVNAVSNRVTVYEILNREESFTPYLHYDFNSLTNTKAQSSLIDDFSGLYPDFYGEQIRYPASSTGMVQISGSEKADKGFLVHHGHDPYSQLTLLLRAKRYNHEEEAKTMTIDWIDFSAGEVVTNAIGEIALDLELKDFTVPLTMVCAQKAAILFNAGGKDSNHRVIIDDIRFVKDYLPALTTTNILTNAVIRAREAFRVRGLEASKTYFARVSAFDGRGKESSSSRPVAFKTTKSDCFCVIVR